MNRKPRILVDGYFNLNLGDDLFFNMLFSRYPECDFIALCPPDYRRVFSAYPNVRVIGKSLIFKLLGKVLGRAGYSASSALSVFCDAAVLIGGSIFIEPNKPQKITIGKIPFFIIGSNYGPEKTTKYRSIVAEYLSNADDVCLRDEKSYELFSYLGNIRLAPDTIFGYVAGVHGRCETVERKTFVSVINLDKLYRPNLAQYKDAYERFIGNLIVSELERGRSVVLSSFCAGEGDERAVNRILESLPPKLRGSVETECYRGDIEHLLRSMDACDRVVGSRFHSVVLGLALGKRVLPIAYSNKTVEMLRGLNKKCLTVGELTPGLSPEYIFLTDFEIKTVSELAVSQFFGLDEAVCKLSGVRNHFE